MVKKEHAKLINLKACQAENKKAQHKASPAITNTPIPDDLSFKPLPKKWQHKTIVLGIGTGRSGTMALSRLLDSQANTRVSHEWRKCYLLEWSIPKDNPNLAQLAADLRIHTYAARNADYIGDIALWYLPYVEMFLKHSNVKIIALKRNKEDCINSFVKWFGQWRHFPWLKPEFLVKSDFRFHPDGYDPCYPKYDFGLKSESSNSNSEDIENFNQNILSNLTIRQGAEIYYDDYNQQIDALKLKYPDRIKICDSYEILNSREVQIEVLEGGAKMG